MTTTCRLCNLLYRYQHGIIRRSAICATRIRRLLRFIRITRFCFCLRILTFSLTVFLHAISNLISTSHGIRVIIFRRGRVRRTSAIICATASFRYRFLRSARTQDDLTNVRCANVHAFRLLNVLVYRNNGTARTLRSIRRRALHLRRELCLTFRGRNRVAELCNYAIVGRRFRLRNEVRATRRLLYCLSANRSTQFFCRRFKLTRYHDEGTQGNYVISVTCVFNRDRICRPIGRFFFLVRLFCLSLFSM